MLPLSPIPRLALAFLFLLAAAPALRAEHIVVSFNALQAGLVKAVVYAAPVLMYYLAVNNSKELHLVGHLFDKQKYGFGLQMNSKLRQQLNGALLTVEESDYPDKLDKIYFTPTDQ